MEHVNDMSQGFGPNFDKAQRAYDYRYPDEEDERRWDTCRNCGAEFEVLRVGQRTCDECGHREVVEDDE